MAAASRAAAGRAAAASATGGSSGGPGLYIACNTACNIAYDTAGNYLFSESTSELRTSN